MPYETVIGLEVHVQLSTKSKLFCSCRNRFTHDMNSQVCPVCLGHPGVLPVLNRKAFELGMKTALALNCTIAGFTKFDRKHYYYPDLPKNYQISQYDLPFAEHGYLDVTVDGKTTRLGITRVHLEEDAGKLIHGVNHSTVDLNRTGTPLAEIVSEPDMRSPEEAREYLVLLRQILRYVDVSDCNMSEGSLRCDANISIRPKGQKELGVKNEIKNMNSFKAVENAIRLVREELIAMTEAGEEIKQITWGYSIEEANIFKMRTKEYANDYRYFPEPDLPPVHVEEEWINRIRNSLPELPEARRKRFISEYSLSEYDAGVLTHNRKIANYFEAVAKASSLPKESANWVINDVLSELDSNLDMADINEANFPLSAGMLSELLLLVSDRTINIPTAREVFSRLVKSGGGSPKAMVEAEGLGQVSDQGLIEKFLEEAIVANPKAAQDIENGKHQTAAFFIGKVMQALKGQGDPAVIGEVIGKRFNIDAALFTKKKKK